MPLASPVPTAHHGSCHVNMACVPLASLVPMSHRRVSHGNTVFRPTPSIKGAPALAEPVARGFPILIRDTNARFLCGPRRSHAAGGASGLMPTSPATRPRVYGAEEKRKRTCEARSSRLHSRMECELIGRPNTLPLLCLSDGNTASEVFARRRRPP